MSMLEKTCFSFERVASTEKKTNKERLNGSATVAVPFLLPAMLDIWIQGLDADSTTQECDQERTNKGETVMRRNSQNWKLD